MHDDIYQAYLEELAAIPELSDTEERQLLERVKSGDKAAGKRLVEGMLSFAVEVAKAYGGQGLPLGDLVQEANLTLLLSLDEYESGDFRAYLKPRLEASLLAAVESQKREKTVEEELAARVNVLGEVSRRMADELGREATVEELADRMKMTADEIRAIMKLTLDAMSVSPGEELNEE